MAFSSSPELYLVCRLITLSTFSLSLIHKVTNFRDFQHVVGGMIALSGSIVSFATVLLMFLEVLMLIAIILMPTVGLWVAFALLSGYSVILLIVLRKRIPISCSCFSLSDEPISRYDVIRNLLLLAITGLGIIIGTNLTTINAQQTIEIPKLILAAMITIAYLQITLNLRTYLIMD